MKRPTLQQVIEYMHSIGGSADQAEEFIDHYATIGWVCGKNRAPMKSWKAGCRQWLRRQRAWNPDQNRPLAQRIVQTRDPEPPSTVEVGEVIRGLKEALH